MVNDDGQYCHDTKWVYKRKYADDLPDQWRSRLVLRGFQQKNTEDYFETFLPVLRKESLSLFFALCDWFHFVCNQTDVIFAFTYAFLEEVIHIKPPTGVNVPHGYVLRVAYGVLWPEACTAHVVSADEECVTPLWVYQVCI